MASYTVYLIDCSGSMGKQNGLKEADGSKLDEVARRLKGTLSKVGPEGISDRYAICAFRQKDFENAEIIDLHHLASTCSESAYAAALDRMTLMGAKGGSPIGPALKHAMQILEATSSGEKIIMLVTDASDTLGEDPRLSVYRALLSDIRINAIALGKGSDRKMLAHLAKKTGGAMLLIEKALELSEALVPRHRSIELPPEIAAASRAFDNINVALGRLESEYRRDLLDSIEYVRRKAALKQSISDIATQSKGAREKAERELSNITMEKNAMMRQLSDLRQRFESRELNRKHYLEQSSPIEDRVACLNEKIAVEKAILALPSEDYVSLL